MGKYDTKDIRNIVLLGHGHAGKTSLSEAMLFLSKATDRLGKIAEGNTVSDYDSEEIKRGVSVNSSVLLFEWLNKKINIIDTPGLLDFASGTVEGLRAGDCSLVVVSGKSGVAVGTEKAVKSARKKNMGRIFFISKMDSENADYFKAFNSLVEKFGTPVCPVLIPYMSDGKIQCYINLIQSKAFVYKEGVSKEVPMPAITPQIEELETKMYEAVAETEDELMEKYFAGETFTKEEMERGIRNGLKQGKISPVYCGSSLTLEGVDMLMNALVNIAPSPSDAVPEKITCNDENVTLKVDKSQPQVVFVFKTVADPFVGKLSYFKVLSGTVTGESVLINTTTDEEERLGKVMIPCGKATKDATEIIAGEIGAVSKLSGTNTGDLLCDKKIKDYKVQPMNYPNKQLSMAIYAKKKGDEDKIAAALSKLIEEDRTIGFYNNKETHEMILEGMGEQHMDVVLSRLKTKYGVEAELQQPIVAYRETIRKKVKVEGKHKKQTGGHGQYGDVWIEFEPTDSEGLVFEEKIFGGSVPKGYFPAVEKGLKEAMQHGILAGYPMVGLKATLVDGSYHPVDSSEMAFKMAAAVAYREGMKQASPALLEPIGMLKVSVPESKMGDVMGDINKRRGRVMGMTSGDDNMQQIEAEVPVGEMHDFSIMLRSVTQGKFKYDFEFLRYEDAPAPIVDKIMEASSKGSIA